MKISKKAFSLLELSIVVAILAVLIIGIMQGTKVVKNARLIQAQKLTKDSPVALIDGLSFWIEPTLEGSLINAAGSINIKDGDAIQTWNDINMKSVNKKNVSQANTTRQPTYVRYGINNLPSVKFDGTDDWLERANVFGYELAESNSIEFFVVYNNTNSAASPIWWQSASANNRINIHAPNASTNIIFDFGSCCTANVSRLTYTAPANFLNNNLLLNGIRRTSGTGDVRVNGVTLTIANNAMTGSFDTSPSAIFSIGGITGGTYLVKGQIAEVIIFSHSLESDDRALVEKYLSKKWGIKLP